MELTLKEFRKDCGIYFTREEEEKIKSVFNWANEKVSQMQAQVIVKLAEKRLNRLYTERIPYVNDDCDDIVNDIDDEIELLKKLIDGLKYYIKNISKFSE